MTNRPALMLLFILRQPIVSIAIQVRTSDRVSETISYHSVGVAPVKTCSCSFPFLTDKFGELCGPAREQFRSARVHAASEATDH